MKKSESVKILSVLALAFLVVFFFLEKILFAHVATALLILALFENPLADLISKSWLKTSELIGNAISFILLFLVYFLVLTPVALLRKVLSPAASAEYDASGKKSLFYYVPHSYGKKYFEKTW